MTTLTSREPRAATEPLPQFSSAAEGRKRYAVVGTGARARVFIDALAGTYRDSAQLVGLCDISPTRMAWHNARLRQEHGHAPVQTYGAGDFERMIFEQGVEVVIVTTIDALHHEYIVRAMNAGCDVIVEKPMTTDAPKAAAIREAMDRTGRDLRVTFNVRYQPIYGKARELIANDAIGQVLAVNFNYTLDTRHGADYFRRWHRDKANSGGLLVHKATHHFDLVNWLMDSVPAEVFAFGNLQFYGQSAAASRGESYDYARYTGVTSAEGDPFALRLDDTEYNRTLYQEAEAESGYVRDRNVFGADITTEDTLAVLARYANGAVMNYSLLAYAPQEGYDLAFTGSRGRMEIRLRRTPHVLDPQLKAKGGVADQVTLRVMPMFQEPYEVELPLAQGGHGGGDVAMLADIFAPGGDDPLRRDASYHAGLASLSLGIAANASIATSKLVRVQELFE